jgi:hypothetical protein
MSETNQRSREQRLRANAILAKLPEGEFGKISERVELIELDLREQVYQPGQAIHQVYFPTSAVFSLMAVGDEQASVEVATVGVEGMVGLPLFLGANTTPHAGFFQIPGQAARMNATDLRAALRADGQLHRCSTDLSTPPSCRSPRTSSATTAIPSSSAPRAGY